MQVNFIKIGVAATALMAFAANADAAETRLTALELDRVTAGADLLFPGSISSNFGDGTFTPLASPTFGGFEILDGPLKPKPVAETPPPVITPPSVGPRDLRGIIQAALADRIAGLR